MAQAPMVNLYNMGQDATVNRLTESPPSSEQISPSPSSLSRRQRRAANIPIEIGNLSDAFRRVFPNAHKRKKDGQLVTDRQGNLIPASNLKVLRLINGVSAVEKDDRTTLVISGQVKNSHTGSVHNPEIALYRDTVKDPWSVNSKGKVICDCGAYQYNLAYPNRTENVFRDIGIAKYASQIYAANTTAGVVKRKNKNKGGRVKPNTPTVCKHLKKLWDRASANLSNLALNGHL